MINLILAMLSLSPTNTTANRVFFAAPIIWQEAQAADEDPYLIAAIAWHESAFSHTAKSNTADCGIMQINTKWSRHTCAQLTNIRTSIKAGIRALAYWRKRFAQAEPNYLWLCHYNSGNKCYTRSIRYARKVRRTRALLLAKAIPNL